MRSSVVVEFQEFINLGLHPQQIGFPVVSPAQAFFSQSPVKGFNVGLFILPVRAAGSDSAAVELGGFFPFLAKFRAAIFLHELY